MPLYSLSSKLNRTVAQSADVTEASVTTPVDIPGLSVVLPRAGTYHVTAVLPWTAGDATSRTMGVGLAYSGSTTFVSGAIPGGTGTSPSMGLAGQTTMGTLGAITSQSGTVGRLMVFYTVVVSTSGTLKFQFSRSAASITHTSGVMTVREA